MKKMLVGVGVAVALASSVATATEYKYDVTPVIGVVMPEGNLDLDDQLSFGLRLGKKIKDSWISKVELGLEFAPAVEVDYTNGEEVDIFRGTLNLVKDIPLTNNFGLYGLAGLGIETLSDNWRYNNDRLFLNYGLGAKYSFTDALALVADIRHGVKLNANPRDYTQNNLFATLGLSYSWGAVEEAAPVVVEEPKKEVVEVASTPGDDDNDGVLNDVDECPSTPAGVPVDERGCARTISLHVNFNFDKSNVLPKYDTEIDAVANFMNKYPVYKVMLEGHTDSIGSDAYNMGLSDRRSLTVAKALKDRGVDGSRISTVGYGEAKPVATNKTKEGRAENRRVDAVFSY